MKILKRITALILAMALGITFCSCANQNNEIKELTKQFEISCNKLDLNSMLDCIDPTISNSVKTITGLIGMFSDKDTDELLDKFAKLLFKEMPENSKEFFSSININIGEVEKEEDMASATAEISYNISGETHKTTAIFEYTCIEGKWYISNFDLE